MGKKEDEDKIRKALKREAMKRVPPKKDDKSALEKIRKRTEKDKDK